MKRFSILISKIAITVAQLGFTTQLMACTPNYSAPSTQQVNQQLHPKKKTKIQVALLLDTSSSMSGLIDQAKGRLWNIINTLTTLRYEGVEPILEISLYEYGNDNLNAAEGFVRQVTPFTTDLDYLSEKLFALTINGGLEYCGTVIQKSVQQLQWDNNDKSMRLIYIAGNEAFSQGNIHYNEAISSAIQKNIYVNTIYCGDYKSGISLNWQNGALKGNGKYFNIDHNVRVKYIETPYDKEIEKLNVQLNSTYHGYGTLGKAKKSNQVEQDANAQKMDKTIYTERAVSKSKGAYTNESWDMVDAYKKDKNFTKTVQKEALPEEFQGLSEAELEAKIVHVEKERSKIQEELNKKAKERTIYIEKQSHNSSEGDDLGKAIIESIFTLAKQNQYTIAQ